MGVGKVQANQPNAFLASVNSLAGLLAPEAPQYYLFEWTGQGWVRYQDYTKPVNLPRYLADPAAGYVTPLSAGTAVYDYINQDGHKNIGAWIDAGSTTGRTLGREGGKELDAGVTSIRLLGFCALHFALDIYNTPSPLFTGLA